MEIKKIFTLIELLVAAPGVARKPEAKPEAGTEAKSEAKPDAK